MMTDFEKLRALLEEFGVGFDVEQIERNSHWLITCSDGDSKVEQP